MTSSTRSPGDRRAASVILNRMFSLPDTRFSSATKSLVTFGVRAGVDPVHGRDQQVGRADRGELECLLPDGLHADVAGLIADRREHVRPGDLRSSEQSALVTGP